MALIFNNRVCVFANELIAYNPKRNVGSKDGFIPEGTFQTMKNRKQILVLHRSTPGQSAIVDFETMREDVKRKYIEIKGDPRATLAVQSQKSILEEAIIFSNDAFVFYSTKYRYDGGKKLPDAKIDEYALNVRVLEAILYLKDEHRKNVIGTSGPRINMWKKLCALSNDLLTLRDPHGKPLFPHSLPQNAASLKRKCQEYEAARRIGREEGYRSLIHKNFGNKSAAVVKDEESEAILHKLISLHNNLNSVQIMEEYNKVAEVLDKPLINSPVTVDNYKKKMELTTMQGRKGKKAVANTRKMQIHREAPTQALTYWTLDGWTAELLYQKKVFAGKGTDGQRCMKTISTNRKTIVYVMDACCKYPVGYAIGDNESPALIREALRNAVRHTKELFGKRYKPLQLQSDNYAKKTLTPFYRAMTKYYTPAAVGNAKAKIIEPHFHYLNVRYCQKQANWSGFGITSRTENQPNMEALNDHRKLVPDEATCIGQIEAIVAQERALHLPEFMAAWERTEESRKLPFSDEEYLLLMGETTGRTNHINGDGLRLEMQGERINYDTFDISLREHYNEDWIVRYDPEDMSRILISNAVRKGLKDAGKEIGTLRYMMQRCMKSPMALADQKPEHFEYRNRVESFNEELQQRIDDKVSSVDGHIKNLRQRIPELINNTLLDRYLITDSRGQHKDARSEMRDEAMDADYEEVTERMPQAVATAAGDEDEDYEFNAADMNFSR
ncbi:hypothetical protein J8L13_04690 [Bacteroides fragilis]|uniref:hypothetical protein n=1 Tax=Bacteroides fragilis TaxID=817 RepID=UPI002030B6E1|nr:hypothetical protein [Bacteroides fragilis]MCM0236708.1 hypothetical protein [Bacteroides fragilis]